MLRKKSSRDAKKSVKKFAEKKQMIAEKIADHLLAQGMKRASLRPLAAVAGTSDRMLLHYFADKKELMTAILILISERLITMLDSARSEQMQFQTLIKHLSEMIKAPNVRPYLKIWLELASSVDGGDDYYRTIARQICDQFYGWLASALKVEKEEERKALASLAFAITEGFVLFDALDSDLLISNAIQGLEFL